MSMLNKPIDFKRLEDELTDAIRADELYKLQNDAKFRAIEQRVPTYDHFRNMVLTAHLKPLDRTELQKKAEVSWNHFYAKNEQVAALKTYERPSSPSQELEISDDGIFNVDFNLKNETEFFKVWKNLRDSLQKLKLIYQNRNNLKNKFFKIEVPTELLEDFLKISLGICSEDTASSIIDILQIFSECNRFSLTLAMLSSSVKPTMKLLFKKLKTCKLNGEENCRIERLVNIYCNF